MNRSITLLIAVTMFYVTAPAALAQCSWNTLFGTVDFGTSYSVFGGPATTTTTGRIQCTGNRQFRVQASTGSGGVYSPYRIIAGPIQYNVYTNAGMTTIWGDGSAGTGRFTGTNPSGTNTFALTAYARMPAGQDIAPGTYTDTLTVVLRHRPGGGGGGGGWTNLPGQPLRVTMTILPQCRVDTFNLTFPPYSPLNVAALPGSSTVRVYCTRTTLATFALDNGANASGLQKRMVNAGNFLDYTATLASGSGTSTTSLAPIGSGIALNASIPAGQDVPAAAGSYIDTLQVIVNY
ncbi:MAG: Csu type fimbrial protein [Thermoanaerobaculia bacterium]